MVEFYLTLCNMARGCCFKKHVEVKLNHFDSTRDQDEGADPDVDAENETESKRTKKKKKKKKGY